VIAQPDIDDVKAFCLETPMSMDYVRARFVECFERHGAHCGFGERTWDRWIYYLGVPRDSVVEFLRDVRREAERFNVRCSLEQTRPVEPDVRWIPYRVRIYDRAGRAL